MTWALLLAMLWWIVIANFPPFVIANAVKQSGVALVGHRERSMAIYGWLPPRVEIAASLRSSQ
jgi:hypothetical protein